MKRETYERALRSAAQISFLSLPLVGACGEPGAEPAEDTVAGLVSELCADGCEAALKGAYPNGDPNWYDAARPTQRVRTRVPVATLVECCSDLAASLDAVGEGYAIRDTGCCSLNNETHAVENLGLACTPWGPPMPRAMRRRQVLS
jgi:hypothetical protein